VLTQEYFRGRFIDKALRDVDLLPTRKHVPEPFLIRKLYKKIQERQSIVIYPEGGRRWDGRPLPWIESTAKIFVKSGIPIYPIITHGSYASWPRWATYPRLGRMRIEVHEPFVFDRKTPFEDALARLKAPMDFDESLVPEDLKPRGAYRPADGIHRLLYRDPETGASDTLYTPDGTYVVNRAGTFRYKMLPDSTLLDEKTGQIHTTAELHTRILELPLKPDLNGAYIRDNVEMHVEHTFPVLEKRGWVTATLFGDAVRIEGESERVTLSLESILHTGVERNSKLQFFLPERMIQLTFSKAGSALEWQETIGRLKAAQLPSFLAEPPTSGPAVSS
jgi:hypothetical protein